MNTFGPRVIDADNVSEGWGKVLVALSERGVKEIAPLVLTIRHNGGDEIEEVPAIRSALDAVIAGQTRWFGVDIVAWTIFPIDYWRAAEGDRQRFFDEYRATFPRIQAFNRRDNAAGAYFQRLVDFGGGGKGFNQLDFLLRQHDEDPSYRRSMWQATTFDPLRDHSRKAQLQFPCLQQISLSFLDDGAVVLNAFYATQQIVKRGYGNYLGLMQLGHFLAGEMGRSFAGLAVYVGIAKMDSAKTDPAMQTLLNAIYTHEGETTRRSAA